MRGAEEHVTGTDLSDRILDLVSAGTGGNEIEFVALVRYLRSIGRTGGESDFKIAIDEHFR
jgi:hypothetical protein